MADLIYQVPPKNDEETARRVYVLPVSLVRRIHKFGFDNGHQSEVSAIKALIELGLENGGGND